MNLENYGRLKRALIGAGVAILLVAVVWYVRSVRQRRPVNALVVDFVGLTNNPVRQRQPFRLEVSGNGIGLYVLFRITNQIPGEYIYFDTERVEVKEGTNWVHFGPSRPWYQSDFGGTGSGINGSEWVSGHHCLVAVEWPPGLPTNSTWRLTQSVGHHVKGIRELINSTLKRPIFSEPPQYSVTSSEVSH